MVVVRLEAVQGREVRHHDASVTAKRAMLTWAKYVGRAGYTA